MANSERKYWCVIDMPKYGGAFVSRYRLSEKEINKIMEMYRIDIDLLKEFGCQWFENIIQGIIKTDTKDRAERIVECLNNGGTFIDALEVE